MSDEDANYDDFMMSDEEDMAMIEMEEATEDEDNDELDVEKDDTVEVSSKSKEEDNNLQSLEKIYETGISLEEDQNFIMARDAFSEVTNADQHMYSPLLTFKAMNHTLKSWASEIHYSGITEEMSRKIMCDWENMVVFLRENSDRMDVNYLQASLSGLLDELFPNLTRGFLFNIEAVNHSSLMVKMQMQLQCVDQFERLIDAEDPLWVPHLKWDMKFKQIMAKIWFDRLTTGSIDMRDLQSIEDYCGDIEEATIDTDATYIDKISLILQCHIFNFFETAEVESQSVFMRFVKKLEQLMANSLSISQHLGLVIQLDLAKAILLLLDDTEEDSNTEVPKFYDNVRNLREQFWGCLQNLEETGGSQHKFSSLFEKFILAGFIFSSMILYNVDEDKINPFDFEQVKIANRIPYVEKLGLVYHNYINLDLKELYLSIQQLPELQKLLSSLIETTYYLAQIAKLWTKIAPVYTCISLRDIQNMLSVKEKVEVTRDDLLTVLMRSIMKDNADIFYKLDLTKDLVYFGDEYKVQLCMYAKESFAMIKNDTTLQAANGIAKLSDLEFANNVGIFDQPQRLKKLDSTTFFDRLQRARENVHTKHVQSVDGNAGFLPSRMRFSNKYGELAELATSHAVKRLEPRNSHK